MVEANIYKCPHWQADCASIKSANCQRYYQFIELQLMWMNAQRFNIQSIRNSWIRLYSFYRSLESSFSCHLKDNHILFLQKTKTQSTNMRLCVYFILIFQFLFITFILIFYSMMYDLCGFSKKNERPNKSQFMLNFNLQLNFMLNFTFYFLFVCLFDFQLNLVIMILGDIRLDMYQNSDWLPINQKNWKIELQIFINSLEECHRQPPN